MFNFENKRKMKKIVLVCIVAIMATAAQAQIYVGGTLGFSSVKTENSDAELKTTTIKLLPEIGYVFRSVEQPKTIRNIQA